MKHDILFLITFSLVAGEAHSLEVNKILFKERSDYQEVLVFEVLESF